MAKRLLSFHAAYFAFTSLGLLVSLLWPTETFVRLAAFILWLCSAAIFVGSLAQYQKTSTAILAKLLGNKVRVFAILFFLISMIVIGLTLVLSRVPYALPPLALYIPFVIVWPLLTAQALKAASQNGTNRVVRTRKWLTTFQQLMVSVILFALLLELLLQLGFNYLPAQITMPMPQMPRRIGIYYSPELRLDLYPSGKVTQMMDGFSGDLTKKVCPSTASAEPRTVVTYTRDQYGFRNVMPWPDRIDIAFTGDSFVAAEVVQKPMWDGLVDAQTLLQLGLPGSGQLEQAILLRNFALPRKPKVVILAYYEGNDLVDNWSYHQLSAMNMSRYDTYGDFRPADYLVSYQAIRWLGEKLTANPQQNCQDQIIDPHGNVLLFSSFDSSTLTLDKEALRESQLFAITKSAIQEVAKEVKDSGAELVILYIPDKLHAYWNGIHQAKLIERVSRDLVALQPDPIGGLKPDDTLQYPDSTASRLAQNIDDQRDIIKETVEELGVLFLDLTPALQAAAGTGKVLYFYGDGHLNQAGHDLAREVIRKFLEQHNLLD